jgi:hypothetical protein
MITLPMPALFALALLIVGLLALLYLQMLMIRNRNEMIATDERLIANYQKVNECNDRIIQLQEEQIGNAEKRAANYEYLYTLAKDAGNDASKLMGYIANANYCMDEGDLDAAQGHLTDAMKYLQETV